MVKNVDYLVVGLGIAGISVCEELREQDKTFVAVDSGAKGATATSGGVFNPTVLKRFTAAWNAASFFSVAVEFYRSLEKTLGIPFFIETPILRIFSSVSEQNNWSVASDKKLLNQYITAEFLKNPNPSIHAPLGFGKVLGTAQILTEELLSGYREFLMGNNSLVAEHFDYEKLIQTETGVVYKDMAAKKVIFAEGAQVVNNPFFPKQCLIGNKGEYLIIKAPGLNLNQLLKGPLYVIPLGNDVYKVGATYKSADFSMHTTQAAKKEMLSSLKTFINCPFELIGQTAGVRPTTMDHRPLLGSLSAFPNLVFLNGLGSRGFLMAPLLSKVIYDFVENGVPVPPEMALQRML